MLTPTLVTSILGAESHAQEMKRFSIRGTCAIFWPLLLPSLPLLHPLCPTFPRLVMARDCCSWQGAACCLAASPNQPARLLRAQSCFLEGGSAKQETGCLGSLTVSKHRKAKKEKSTSPSSPSHHHCGCWPSPLKITTVLLDTCASRGQRRTIHPRAAGTEWSRAGVKLGAFSPSPFSIHKAACVVPAVLVNSDQGRLSLFVFTSRIQPALLRIAVNCLFPARSALLPVVLMDGKESMAGIMVWVTLAQSCSCLKPKSPPPLFPPLPHPLTP